MADNHLLKNIYDDAMISRIGSDLQKAWPPFNVHQFKQEVLQGLGPKSLTERAWAITETMRTLLPDDYEEVAVILKRSFAPEHHRNRMEGMQGFYYMPHGNYVAKYGLDHFDVSIDLLREITIRFTAEFHIRPFLEKYPERTLAILHEWIDHPNVHIRRLVSEGTRPRLPWSSHLKEFQKDPAPVLALLEKLKADPELYVRRSVANNLNDIGKDHPEMVLEVLIKWNNSKDEGTKWIIKHAARSLIKAGNTKALALLGYDPNIKIDLVEFNVDAKVEMGKVLGFSLSLKSKETASKELMVDFIVHYNKANGKLAPKVFKLAKTSVRPNGILELKKNISFKPINTRKYYAGQHAIEIQVNGQRLGKVFFELMPH